MLTGDVCMHVLDIHTGLLGDEEAQTSRVEVGAGAEHTRCRQTRELHGDMGDDVHRVGDEHVDRVRGDLEHVRDDRLHDVDRGTGEIEAD